MSERQLAQWFSLLVDMLKVGFPLRRALSFAKVIMPKQAPVIDYVATNLSQGISFATAVRPWVTADQAVQLQLAERHGELTQALGELSTYLTLRTKEKQKLRALLQYPVLLLALLIGLGVVLRLYVYPELQSWQVWQLPTGLVMALQALLGALGALGLLGGWRYLAWRRQPRLNQVNALCRLPGVGRLVQLYFSYYLVSNLALLVRQGLSLKEICALLQQAEPTTLLYQLGQQLQVQGSSGAALPALIQSQPCLPDELVALLGRGWTNQQLGQELAVFARLQFQRLTRQVESWLTLVQPVLFLIVALGILGMYLSLLLPIYQSIAVVE